MLSKEQLLEELEKIQETVDNWDTRKIRADSLLLEFICDPEIDETYMKYAYKE